MHKPKGIDPTQAHEKVIEGAALLVCAYEDESRCQSLLLERSITRADLEQMLNQLPKEQEIIFYCA